MTDIIEILHVLLSGEEYAITANLCYRCYASAYIWEPIDVIIYPFVKTRGQTGVNVVIRLVGS